MTEEQVFLAALDLPDAAARAVYLDEACAGDAELRRQVEELLAVHFRSGEFLNAPMVKRRDNETAEVNTVSVGDAKEEPDDLHFLQPPTRPDSLGRIGHYEVLQVLGRGGFGIVFRAFDDVLQRVVAVKVLAPGMAATSPARKRFLREARSSAAIRQENVVQVHQVEEQPLPYLVMEYIPGETLQQRLDRTGPLDLTEILRIGRQVAEGLAAAHAQGLIHRDVKPANVLIESGPHGRAKLTDFGLARAADDASISQSGVVAGTPMYMAPEQAKGEALDPRSDLFSLGSVLYVMSTGRPPFRANSTMAVLKRVCEDTPRPIREVIPEMPEWLCRVVQKLHAKDPAARYQSAREVADMLADCERQVKEFGGLRDFSRVPGGGPARRGWRWVAAALVLIPLVALAAWALSGPAAGTTRNPFGLPDVHDPDGADVQALAAAAHLPGGPDDANAEQWVERASKGDASSLDGEWSCRWWEPGRADWGYLTSPVRLKTVGDRVFFLYADAHGRILLETKRVGNRLIGREWKIDRNETFPCVLQVVSPERLDGTYGGGSRMDFRRRLGTTAETGWTALFNGKDLTGWKTHEDQPGDWRVEGGAIVGRGPLSHLFSDRGDYSDFQLRVEARVNAGGDSGLVFRSEYGVNRFRHQRKFREPNGYEAQILFNEHAGTWKTGTLIGPEEVKALHLIGTNLIRPDEWFTMEVTARGNRITIRVDGKTVVEFTDTARHYTRGHLALQRYHAGTVVEFRKIEVKELPPEAQTDRKRLQGRWRLVAAERHGKPVPVAELKSVDWIEFTGDKQTTFWDGKQWPGTYTLNPAAEPRELDFLSEKYAPVRCLYRIEDDRLVMAQGLPGQARPTGFRTTPDTPFSVATYARNPAPVLAVAPFNAARAKVHQDAWAKHLGVPVEIESVAGMKMRLIPPGEYLMGTPEADLPALLERMRLIGEWWVKRAETESPAQPVRLTRAYRIGATEVTVGQFRRFVKADSYKTEVERGVTIGRGMVGGKVVEGARYTWDSDIGVPSTDDHPVVNVTWNDAKAFCVWLSRHTGRVYRLPTEEEWEFACRAGTTTTFYSGDDYDLAEALHWKIGEVGLGGTRPGHRPVAGKRPNAFGLYDLHGNVSEWCQDRFAPFPRTRPRTVPAQGEERIVRGGGWPLPPEIHRSASRTGCIPTLSWVDLGFRVVMEGDLSPPEAKAK